MATCDEIIELDLEDLEHSQLLEIVKGLQKCCQDYRSENARQEEELKRVQRAASFPSSTSSFNLQSSWSRANVDSPGDMSWSCFGEKSKYPTVMVYNRSRRSLETRDREDLKSESAIACIVSPLLKPQER
jgi:hypothetical protein